jgi:hypothetical protein
MAKSSNRRASLSRGSYCRVALIVLAIFSLTASLATRYTLSSGIETPSIRAVKSNSPDAKTQNLLSDGIHWVAPASIFSLFEPRRASVSVISAVFVPTNLSSESWLYNRPPPSC